MGRYKQIDKGGNNKSKKDIIIQDKKKSDIKFLKVTKQELANSRIPIYGYILS